MTCCSISTARPTILPTIVEEVPMTIQFGLVGSDGVAIVGDTLHFDSSSAIRTTFKASKIRYNSRGTIAIAWAGDGNGLLVSKRIAQEMPDDCDIPQLRIEEIEEKTWDSLTYGGDSVLLIAMRTPEPRLFRLHLGKVGASIHNVLDRVCSGDAPNIAAYFVERYYQRRPIEELAAIAAHSVLLAHKFNSGGIGGLEITLCRKSGFTSMPVSVVPDIEAEIQQFDRNLETTLLSCGKKFTYAPDVIG